MTATIVGLDLSLASTGVARADASRIDTCTTVKTVGHAGDSYAQRHARSVHIRRQLAALVKDADLIVIEGPSFGSAGAGTWDRAGLWWAVYDGLAAARFPIAVVPPKSRAMFATGKGNAGKADVLTAVIRRYASFPVANDNEADAVVLAEMGRHHLGLSTVDLPPKNVTALTGVVWPS